MTFDKIKAMRSAERYLSQGKIRAAIGEYKLVVENDPKDFNTLNMLGDLFMKNKEQTEAVGCFTRVAEYYGKQGFSQKAIAIYNKISRLQPDSMEVSARLAELYQAKGSVAEARTHYVALADQYSRVGKKMEALSIWKQIAELDPNNAEVYLKIAESYWQEKQKDEAAEAFTIAGTRLTAQGRHEAALTAFSRALEIRQHDFNALNGFVKSQINLGYSDEAAKTLENILEQQPYNRDILFLLVECHLDTNNPAAAERATIKLVEQEPANYPKFLELVEVYLKNNDLDSATRILSMSSEHLLVGGQSEEFLKWTNEILARNPEHLNALRLLVRYYGWNRDEAELKKSLERMLESAVLAESYEDEKNALSQLIVLAPGEPDFAQRLQKLKVDFPASGDSTEDFIAVEADNISGSFEDSQTAGFAEANYQTSETDEIETFSTVNAGEFQEDYDFATENVEICYPKDASGEEKDFAFKTVDFENDAARYGEIADENINDYAVSASQLSSVPENLSNIDQLRLEKEIDSIQFYIEQGYHDLADKSLRDLQQEFGVRAEISKLRAQLGISEPDKIAAPADENLTATTSFDFAVPAEILDDFQSNASEETVQTEEKSSAGEFDFVEQPTVQPAFQSSVQMNDFLDDFRSELGFDESEPKSGDDYETHFHTAVAYSEMGLTEEAIREFQEAIKFAAADDGTRRFFQCAHLLGNCFMEKSMPNLALLWYQRALETTNLNVEEKQGIWYEVGNAYELGGDAEKALENFEMIYAVDVDYRDVRERVQNLHVNS